MNREEYIRKNDLESHDVLSKTCFVSALVIFVICILNLLGIFILNKKSTCIACFLAMFFFCMPCILNKLIKNKGKNIKYIYIFNILIGIMILYAFFTYHACIAFVFPIVMSGFYSDKKLYSFTIVATNIVIVFGNLLSIFCMTTFDEPRRTIYEVCAYGILPEILVYSAVAYVAYKAVENTSSIQSRLFDYSESLEKSKEEMKKTQEKLIYSLAEIPESNSKETGKHIKRVSEYAKVFGRYICYSKDEKETFAVATMLHDIGKLTIPNELLQKPGKLTKDEYEIIQKHTDIGEKLLKNVPGRIIEIARVIAKEHHERWDGTGYYKLKGEEIDFYSRYVSVLDVFDALMSERSYKKPWKKEQVYKEIVSQRGRQFAPEAVDLFIKCHVELENIYFDYSL